MANKNSWYGYIRIFIAQHMSCFIIFLLTYLGHRTSSTSKISLLPIKIVACMSNKYSSVTQNERNRKNDEERLL